MRTLRQTVQGHYRHDLRELQHSFAEMVSDFLSDFIIKEGYQFNGTVKDHRHYAKVGLHKIRYMLEHRNSDNQLRGTVEVDETYIGGKKKGKRGRGSEKQDTSIRGGAAQRSLVNYTSGEYQTHNIGADNPYTDKRRFYNNE